MKKLLISLIISLLVLGAASCKKSPVEPEEEPENLTPGRRDYTWTADTIKNPYLYFYHIWGNSLTNLWTGSMLSSYGLYRYDGTKWELDNRVYMQTPTALWGYEDKLWIGNDNGCIWQFTGSSYQEQVKYHKLGDYYTQFQDLVGTSDKEIYISGGYRVDGLWHSILMKYDGVSWKADRIFEKPCSIILLKYSPKTDKYYLVVRYSTYHTEIVYEYDRTNFKEIYSYVYVNGGAVISVIDGYPYVIIENEVYRYRNDKLELITSIKLPKFGGGAWGRGRNDIFLRMIDGLAHYNGNDVQYQFKVPETCKMNANMAIFEKDVFISAMDFNTGYNIIYHGKLN